jgi:hypothetical protein
VLAHSGTPISSRVSPKFVLYPDYEISGLGLVAIQVYDAVQVDGMRRFPECGERQGH